MRARLGQMTASDQFSCLCDSVMAAKLNRVITLAGGEIVLMDERSFGTYLCIRKK